RGLRVVRNFVPLRLQLPDGLLELRDRGGDVRQLDDVGLGRLRQIAKLGELVRRPLRLGEQLGEGGDDAAGERDVPRLDGDASALREGPHDREERKRSQGGRLVNVRPDDCRRRRVHGLSLE
ncbi:MAG: hypothetical protein UT02_C0004G0021, partial [Parcubacteria group bacterium GW2011_GWC2_38_7]